jgi:hypothetical protein
MSEETQENGMSAIKKAIIGAITTAVTAGGAWFATHLSGGEGGKEEVKTEQVAPAPAASAPVIINLENNNTNQQKQTTNSPQIIRERVIEKPAVQPTQPASKPAKDEEDPW